MGRQGDWSFTLLSLVSFSPLPRVYFIVWLGWPNVQSTQLKRGRILSPPAVVGQPDATIQRYSRNHLGGNELSSILSANRRRCGKREEYAEQWKSALFPASARRWQRSRCCQRRGADIPVCHATTSIGTNKHNEHHPMTDEPASLERKIELLEAELRQTRRMASLGDLVSTTTHEFNNILTTIINYAKLGLRHKDEASRDKALTKILAAAGRAEKITNGVLGMARNRGNDRVPTDLTKLIESSLVLLEREMQKYRIQIVTQFEPAPLANVCGNEIQQVLLNLLTNARQAMPRGGQILIRIEPDAANNTVDLTVRDTGAGIPPDVLPRIFDRYFSTKQGPDATGKGGTGVGLSMCSEIIESHQGKIRVESTVGVGTAFTLKLPAAKAEAAQHVPVPQLGIPTAGATQPRSASS